ncbi:hypothetical protein ABZ642_00195 [Streptomyces sp. NPDC007157]|uniref:hypothetical protein n=1 Tax=Streptomyces sp. NPDC007157 TaxID=3154681 RepID=UPI0033EDC5C4
MPGEDGEHGAVRPGEEWPDAEQAAQHRVLVAQREQLGVLGLLRAAGQQEQSEKSEEDRVEHAQCPAVRACHDRQESQIAWSDTVRHF